MSAATLPRDLRKILADSTVHARAAAERACRAALENLAVHEGDYRPHMSIEQRQLRNRLRARGRALGDVLDPHSGKQDITRLYEHAAYEHWHRLLFTRFLAENHLLHTDPENGLVPVTLDECEELAPDLAAKDGFDLACRFASRILPGVFRSNDPVLDLVLAPSDQARLRELLTQLSTPVFTAQDALGWTYQFWQTQRKEEVNLSGVKIGAAELSPVTQLFTEDYMVEFLLHNTLGAWWAGKLGPLQADSEADARARAALPAREGVPALEWKYLRFVQDADTGQWVPAAGTFPGWPEAAAGLRLLDPSMGSGHFLVFALSILVRLRMEEERLTAAAAVAAVLRDNLHGLELDERCTQIAAFNLALAAWKLAGFQGLPALHLACSGLAPHASERDWIALAKDNDRLKRGMQRLHALFQEAPVLGSLIQPDALAGDMVDAPFSELAPLFAEALAALELSKPENDALEQAVTAQGLAKAAELLGARFTLVLTNVPYLGAGKQTDALKQFCERHHKDAKADLATAFLERCLAFCQPGSGSTALVTPQNWLFLGSYKKLRQRLLQEVCWNSVARLGPRAFETIGGEVVNVALLTLTRRTPGAGHSLTGLDVAAANTPELKAAALAKDGVTRVSQAGQLGNPDAKVSFNERRSFPELSVYADCLAGIMNGDSPKFIKLFWEFPKKEMLWAFLQSSVVEGIEIGGLESVIFFDEAEGHLREEASIRRIKLHNADERGNAVWGKQGLAITQMRLLPVSRYFGNKYDSNVATVVPRDPSLLEAIYAFCRSSEFIEQVRSLDQKLNVTNATFGKVPFDLEHWQKVAAEKYPDGLPKPYSSDPTQWLFNGYPKDSDAPLQVAVARLLGYRWPRQTGSEFPDCPALGPDGLEAFADEDGIVCLPAIHREQPAAHRLRELLAAALGPFDERQLLAQAGAKATRLEDWLQDEFFEAHCKLFHARPFVWHLWDGRKDGFHALVNYHKLDHATLQKLTFAYLGDWIRQQDEDARADKPGAAERLGAAQSLQRELERILEGEPPYDLFIRWKPLSQQPCGWQPDLNDGVRINIRPFVRAKDMGKKDAGLLRAKPGSIHWNKDRGTEPERSKAEYPWFWCANEPDTDPVGGPAFSGTRWNDVHLTLARKRGVR
jgi:hypothetical protein